MSGRLVGRVAIVTGAGDGIGLGVARRFAAEGARVLVAEIDGHRGDAVAEALAGEFGVAALAIRTDVAVRADVEAMVARARGMGLGRHPREQRLGWGRARSPGTQERVALRHRIPRWFYGPLWAMQAAFPSMREQGFGRIISMCSLNGVNAHIGTAEYNSAKEALRALTRTAAREWAQYGITANVICPGAKTAASRRVFAQNPELEAVADASNPMGRLGDPELDIAPVAVFLASDDSRYLTGNTLFVDGGSHINGAPWAPDLPDVPDADASVPGERELANEVGQAVRDEQTAGLDLEH